MSAREVGHVDELTVPADVPVGLHFLRVATKTGVSNLRPVCVDDLPEVDLSAGSVSA